MAAPQHIIRHFQQGDSLTVEVDGWGTMAQSYAVRQLVEQALGEGTKEIRFDLRRCTYLDSTFLGTLLSLHKAACRQGSQVLLVSPTPDCRQVLHKMGLDRVFHLVEEESNGAESAALLTSQAIDSDTFRRNVVDCHRELAELPGPAGAPFRKMVEGFEKEMKNRC